MAASWNYIIASTEVLQDFWNTFESAFITLDTKSVVKTN